jgi:hypothetical protein
VLSRRVTRVRARAPFQALVSAFVTLGLLAVPAGPGFAATPPTVRPPDVRFVVGHELGTVTVPVAVSWPPATATDAPVARYYLQHRVDGVGWRSVTLGSAWSRAATVRLRPGTLNQFRVRARDAAGLLGPWAAGPALWLEVIDDHEPAIVLRGSWQAQSTSSAYGGSLRTTIRAKDSATVDVEATRIAWISSRGPGRGRAHVAVDGSARTTVDLLRSSTQARRIVYASAWSNAAVRRLSIEVEGTPGRPKVELDAVLTLGPPPTAVLVGAGDIATCGGSADEATAAVVAQQPGIVFTAGDNAYPDGTSANFADCYGPSWGRFRARTRPSPGNHDYHASATAQAYFNYFGNNAGPAGRGWYAYDAGTWRVYSLNSNCPEAGGCGPTSAQYTWLAADLSANTRRCVAAYWHHPRFSSGSHGGSTRMKDLLTLLYDRGADVVVAGHDHTYERFAPITPANVADPARGIRHFIVGTGGAPLYAAGSNPAPNSELFANKTHGVLRLTLRWSAYEWQFLPAGSGTFRDSGSGACH